MSYTSTTSNYTQHHHIKKQKTSSINGAQTNPTTKTKPSSSNPNTQSKHNPMSQSLKESTFNNITSTFYKSNRSVNTQTYFLYPDKCSVFEFLSYDKSSDTLKGYIKINNLDNQGISSTFPTESICKLGSVALHKLPDDSLTYINNNLIPRCNRLRN